MIIAFSLSLGMLGAWFISRYAYRFGLLDIPNDRSSHNLPTPRGGGIGILASFIVSSLWFNLPQTIWLPAVVLSLVSFFDDRLDLSFKTRMGFQFAAAAVVVGFHFPGSAFQVFVGPHLDPRFSILSTGILCLLIIILCIFIVGTANFFNFMDGINGIAGISGAVGFALVSVFAHFHSHNRDLAHSAACLSAACIGFLPLNMPRARVFMGDVGSILLGFVFASDVLLLSRNMTDFFVLSGFLSTFYADALTTLYTRKRDGERISDAHRRHLYQLFANQKKVEHWKISCGYGLFQAAIGIALLAVEPEGFVAVIVLEFFLLGCWWLFMRKVRKTVEKQTASIEH
jgi:Fuc2NAc and GlcNAc transferase